MSLLMMKSVLTTILLLVAIAQALGMAQVRGYVQFLPVERKRLRQRHRGGGIGALILALAVAAMCVFGERYAYYPPRVLAHVVMGTLAIVVLLLKVLITHRWRRQLRHNTALGAIAGLLILGTFAASALWVFVGAA